MFNPGVAVVGSNTAADHLLVLDRWPFAMPKIIRAESKIIRVRSQPY